MILYLDTSALVKLYVRERDSTEVIRAAKAADAIATSVVAYAEARAAFARLRRSGVTSEKRHRERILRLDGDWERYVRVELTPAVVRAAGDSSEKYDLRGFDAIHLASALWLRSSYAGEIRFSAYDRRLSEAAAAAGLKIAG